MRELSKGQLNDMFRQMEELFSKVDKLTKQIKKMEKEHKEELKERDKKIEKLEPEIENIENEILNSYYAHFDESQIKVDGNAFNEVCSSTKTHTRMWTLKSKKHEELEKIDVFKSFMGVIVKDGTDLYNGFGTAFSQCISHIQRYLKGLYDFINHKRPKMMAEFLTKYNNYRKELIQKGIEKFEEEEYNKIIKEYEEIIKVWKKEWMNDNCNP